MLSLSDEDLCRNRCFEVKFLSNLPQIVHLTKNYDYSVNMNVCFKFDLKMPSNITDKDQQTYLILDYARYGQLKKCIEFVNDAIKEGDNVGEDEFENDEEFLRKLGLSEVFVLKSKTNFTSENLSSNEIRAFIVIQPCWTSRTIDTCQGCVHIYYDQLWMKNSSLFTQSYYVQGKEDVYMALLHLGIQLTKDIQIGYTDCVLRICPTSNQDRLTAMHKYGFQIAVDIPEGVLIKGKLQRDYVVYKQFDCLRKPRSEEEVVSMISRLYNKEKCDEIFNSVKLKELNFLPRFYKLKNGKILRIRIATKGDASEMYNLMLQASKDGKGYGSYEFPTLEAFKMWMMIDNYCIIYDFVDNSDDRSSSLLNCQMVGCSFIGESWHIRTRSRNAGESSLVVDNKFRGQGLGKLILMLEIGLMKELNYKIMINDFLTSNIPMRSALSSVLKKDEIVDLGIIPNVSYTQGVGWDGQVIRFYDLQKCHIKCFTDIINDNNLDFNLKSKL